MTTYDALLRRLKEAKFELIDCNMEETAADFDDAIFAITQLQRDNAALMEDAAAQIEIAKEAVERAAGLERDAESWRDHMREVERVKGLLDRGFGPSEAK